MYSTTKGETLIKGENENKLSKTYLKRESLAFSLVLGNEKFQCLTLKVKYLMRVQKDSF